MLTPNLDAAFDRGYISFDCNGIIMVSDKLSNSDCEALGIRADMRLRKIEDKHKAYLEYHRKNIYIDK